MNLKRIVFAAVLVALTFVAPNASAQTYPPAAGGLTANKTTVAAGGTVRICGTGFKANSTVTIKFDGTVVKTVKADKNGAFCTDVTVPKNAKAGQHTITAEGVNPAGAPRVLSITITVLPLGKTGTDVFPMFWLGVGAVGVGGGLFAASRRRSAKSTSS